MGRQEKTQNTLRLEAARLHIRPENDSVEPDEPPSAPLALGG